MTSWSYRNTRAFTLVEILAVVLVIGLIAAAAGTTGFKSFRKMQVKKAAGELYLAMKYARLTAVEKQTECRLLIDKEENSYAVVVGSSEDIEQLTSVSDLDNDAESVQVVSNQYTKPAELGDGIAFEKAEIASMYGDYQLQNGIVFRPDGSADAAVIQLGNGEYIYSINVMVATGKAKVIEGPAEEMTIGVVDLDEQGSY
ncbi:type II secretion system protein H [Anaerohalosphaera lusitana]|uniref:Type II secretion system protein H n=1 Tax=Anaerohalosphaera lusitana TaxID=1936003 RepID=A0A1U9NK35_9BACT|nr:prepilin-type N-terminal cleavage/methylation domain-containing protein [Anaerohalosphaera lusitana]AQT68175.1 type II secretion system protein H [Anaerohalosphaera lusitana]